MSRQIRSGVATTEVAASRQACNVAEHQARAMAQLLVDQTWNV